MTAFPNSGPRPAAGFAGTATDQVVELNPIATFVIDADHVVTHWNRACERLTGLRAEEVIGTRGHWRPFYPEERPVMADILLDGGDESEVDQYYHGKYRRSEVIEGAFEAEDFFPAFSSEGSWLFFTAALLRDAEGRITGAIETLQDITARRRAEIALSREKAQMDAIINGSLVAIFVLDRNHVITHMNRACEVLFGVSAKELVGTRKPWYPAYTEPRPVLADLLLDGASPGELHRHYGNSCHASRLIPGALEAEGLFPRLGKGGRWLYLTAAPICDEKGAITGVIETLQDITERKETELALQRSEERYRQLSATDGLTGLGNLRSCYDELEREISRSHRYDASLSVLLLDVDNFKQYNDTWGHMEGDAALRSLAASIRRNLRRTDGAYRYGGEEFVVLMPETNLAQAMVLAERIRLDYAAALLRPAPNVVTSCTVSIGVAQLASGEDAKALLRRADAGTYRAKEAGKNRVVAQYE